MYIDTTSFTFKIRKLLSRFWCKHQYLKTQYTVREIRFARKRNRSRSNLVRLEYQLTCAYCGEKSKWLRRKKANQYLF